MDKKLQRLYKKRKSLQSQTIIAVVLTAVLLAAAWFGSNAAGAREQTIRRSLGQKNYKIQGEEGPQYYPAQYDDVEKLRGDAEQAAEEIAQEGIVLLVNKDNALPLNGRAKVSVFGDFADDTLREALEAEEFQVNGKLWEFNTRGGGTSFSAKLETTFGEYPDAAVVVLRRQEIEESVPAAEREDEENEESADVTSLSLTEEERELLQIVSGQFDKVVVVLDSDYPIDMAFVREYNVSACLWTGAMEQKNAANKAGGTDPMHAKALAKILSGAVNPSGRLPDTWVYNSLSAPAAVNVGSYQITNSKVDHADRYLAYAEGLYVGYRYYETRYEDSFAEEGFEYDDVVAFPFGYGLSYTSFALNNLKVEFVKGSYEVSLDVINTGSTAGKEVVQIYLQKPYTDFDRANGIEVPSVILVGFAKTDLLQPGSTQQVAIRVDNSWKKTFDAAVNGTYITEAGTYYLTAAQNAHEAVNNILRYQGTAAGAAAQTTAGSKLSSLHGGNAALTYVITQQDTDAATYTAAANTDESVRTRFRDADPATWNEDYVPFSRNDWEGTWPVVYKGGSWEAPVKFLEAMRTSNTEDTAASAPVYNTAHGDSNTPLISLRDIEDDDYRWNSMLDQLSWRETYSLVRKGGGMLNEVISCASPQADIAGYANGLDAAYGGAHAVRYPSAPILAATFNEALVEKMAALIGKEALAAGVTLWQTPMLNIHRTGLQARFGDCFSEDSCLTGRMAAAICRGVSGSGVIPVLGRLVLGEQQSGYEGMSVLVAEQALRELYLTGFELAVRESTQVRKAILAGMNRIGARWCGGSSSLLTGVLRSEWGFDGIVMTDHITPQLESYCDILEGLDAGTDVWQNASNRLFSLRGAQLTYGARARFRRAAGRIMRAVLYSNAMNGIGENTKLVYSMAPWKYWRLGTDIVLVLAAFVSGWFALAQIRRLGRIGKKIREMETEYKKQQRRRRAQP